MDVEVIILIVAIAAVMGSLILVLRSQQRANNELRNRNVELERQLALIEQHPREPADQSGTEGAINQLRDSLVAMQEQIRSLHNESKTRNDSQGEILRQNSEQLAKISDGMDALIARRRRSSRRQSPG